MRNIRKTTHSLIDLAEKLGPEDEGMEVDDLNLTVEEIIEISGLLGQMRKAGELVKRALAQTWNDNHAGETAEYGDHEYFLGYASKRVWQPGQDIAFAEWLKQQDTDLVKRIIGPAYGVKVTPLGRPDSPLRETFFDEERTSDDLRIQTRQRR